MYFLPGSILLVAGWVFLRAAQLAAIAGTALFALLIVVDSKHTRPPPTRDQTR